MSNTRLSVNINKVALIRNARGGNLPNLKQVAIDAEAFGAQGITVHPRPDQRHIRFDDIPILKEVVTTEFNMEGNPTEDFLDLVIANKPHQATLVPDPPGVLTSNTGWDTIKNKDFLKDVIRKLQKKGIRVSIFLNPDLKMLEGAKAVGADRVELYTGKYAEEFPNDPDKAIADHIACSKLAKKLKIGLNAGHDLNLENLKFYQENMVDLLEVSIGQALIADALYYGLHNTIQMYLRCLGGQY